MFSHRTFFEDRKKVFSCAGSRTKPDYSARYDETGTLVLDEVGTINVFDDIQSHLDTVEIHALIRRFKAGETDVLSKVQGFYADATKLPDSYVGFLNKVLESQEFFLSLPPEVKEVYGNDYARFIADFDTSSLYRTIVGPDTVDEVVTEPEPEPEPIKKTSRKKTTKTVEVPEDAE